MSDWFIYLLSDPRPGKFNAPRYIGKTTRGAERIRDHSRISRISRIGKSRSRADAWKLRLCRLGLVPNVSILDVFIPRCGCKAKTCSICGEDHDALYVLEKAWIRRFRESGADLVNGTDGGPGTLGHRHSPETRQKIAEISRRPDMREAARRRTERYFADHPEASAHLSEAIKRLWEDAAYRERVRPSWAMRSEGQRRRYATPGERAKLSRAAQARYRRHGERRQASERAKIIWADPEKRERLSSARWGGRVVVEPSPEILRARLEEYTQSRRRVVRNGDEVLGAYREGRTIQDLSAEFGYSWGATKNFLTFLGVYRTKVGK